MKELMMHTIFLRRCLKERKLHGPHWVCSEWTCREISEFICTNTKNTNEIERVHIRSVIKVVIRIAELEERKQIHACILKTGFDSNIFVGNTLVYMYAKCKVVKDVRKVFESMHE